eukprot:CAMPEP_0205805144 /NCGR_PEP_ID=MMETSP0205-20121125/8284_1 /ASSEMBLY_ACC=CAM_ASM_000278 /TAXON_ID=36767 /ORGANISM="Euplotes focardii, Strain TN1" /LENGTH=184 /DNA_ID=CAMNT_0053075901 /DNA_START=376 /DNA_END=930 /DNA_ORIENTATION=-
MIDESTLTNDGKLAEDAWNDILENYKNMQVLIEDTMASSLFSQILNKGNVVLSDDEDEEESIPPIRSKQEIIKERLTMLHKPISLERMEEVSKPVHLFTHYFMDDNNDTNIMNAQIYITPNTGNLIITTEEVKTHILDEFYIDLSKFINEKSLPEYLGNNELLVEKLKDLFNIYAVLEKDPVDE